MNSNWFKLVMKMTKIEYGKKTVKDFEALAFCKVLGISLEDLYSDTDKYYEA